MRLGFHYHVPGQLKDGRIYTMSLQGLFIDHLAACCEKVILFLYKPLKSEEQTLDYAIQSSNVELVSLIKHYSIPVRLLLSPLVRNKVFRRIKDLDILLMRAPTPLLPLITKDIKKKIPYAYLVVGEMTDHIDNIPQAKWRKGFLKKYILWNEHHQRRHAAQALVFANSAVVFNKYKEFSKKTVLVHTTTLTKSDFFVRQDTCLKKPFELLFTGRIERGKGILEITEAVGILNKENVDCNLNIVGWSDAKDPTIQLIREIARREGITEKVIFHGKKSVGDELFGYYRKADIFILASQVAEGFPRTIWEALALSVPVISTSVGSVPYFLKHEHDILLVEKNNALDIVSKVKTLINDPQLRQTLIRNGQKTVDSVTLDIQAEKICSALKDYLKSELN